MSNGGLRLYQKDSHITSRPAQNRDQLGALDDHHARLLSGNDTEDLRGHADGWNPSLDHKGGPRTEFLSRPSRDEEVQRSY